MYEVMSRAKEEVAMEKLLPLMVKIGRRPTHDEAKSVLTFSEYSWLIHGHGSLDKALDDACFLLYGCSQRKYPTEILPVSSSFRPRVRRVPMDEEHERAMLLYCYQRRLKCLQEVGNVRAFREKLRDAAFLRNPTLEEVEEFMQMQKQ